ncbi:hypothetical protein Tco_0697791 [Tanacetum coccineum]
MLDSMMEKDDYSDSFIKFICNGDDYDLGFEYNGTIKATGTLKNGCLPPRWQLLMSYNPDLTIPKVKDWRSKIEAQKGEPLPKEAAGHSKRKKKSGTDKGTNPSQPSASTPVVAELHKEDLQATSDPNSLGVTGEVRVDPQLITKADPGKYDPKDSLSQQQGNDEGTKNFSYDHFIAGTNLSDLVDKTKSARDGLGTIQPNTETKKAPSTTSPKFTTSSDTNDDEEIKLEDLSKLVKDIGTEAMELDSLEDDPPLLILNHDFSSSIPTELKELPSKINDIKGAVVEIKKYIEELEVEVPGDLKELPGKLEDFINKVTDAPDKFTTAIKSTSQKLVKIVYLQQAKMALTMIWGRMGLEVVEKTYRDKVKYDKYCIKMLNQRAPRKITNRDVLSRGKAEAELELDLSKLLEEQDPILKLNLLAKKKRKNDDDVHDYFKSTKRYKKSVQFSAHRARTVLNELYLRMILFNSKQWQYFISIEDFEELNNEMLYNV